MDLVTVTCSRDRYLQRLQSQSINQWVQGKITHWLVINEMDPDLAQWHSLLAPYYHQHQLKLIPGDPDLILDSRECEGWAKQQMLKLRAVRGLDQPVMILDSKNFFISETDLSEWHSQLGSGTICEPRHRPFKSLVDVYAGILNITAQPAQLEPSTPFVIDPRVIVAMPDEAFGFNAQWYRVGIPSEFLYYSMVAQKIGLLPAVARQYPRLDYTCHAEHNNVEWDLELDRVLPTVKILGCHYAFINRLTAQGRERFNDYLISRKLTPLELN